MKSRFNQIIMSSNPTQSLNHYYLVIIISNTDTHSLSVFYIVFYNITFLLASEYIKNFSKIVIFPVYSNRLWVILQEFQLP